MNSFSYNVVQGRTAVNNRSIPDRPQPELRRELDGLQVKSVDILTKMSELHLRGSVGQQKYDSDDLNGDCFLRFRDRIERCGSAS